MYDYYISEIHPSDKYAMNELGVLLAAEGIKLDANLDYTAGIYDGSDKLVATGSCYANTLRCVTVGGGHQGEGLLGKILTHLIDYQMLRGITHLFVYTKADKAFFFSDLGFTEIARVDGLLSFMENRRNGFVSYLERLAKSRHEGRSAALVMNCNPFTLGHLLLIQKAASENDIVHLFVVSEDKSFFPFEDRYELVKQGCADLANIVLHETGSYMISSAVFPSYFLEDDQTAIRAQAKLDVELFKKIAAALSVSTRYVGEEPFSKVTRIYNETMCKELPQAGIECIVIPRKEEKGVPISASQVRRLLCEGRLSEAGKLVPPSTFTYLTSTAGQEIIKKLKAADSVTHY